MDERCLGEIQALSLHGPPTDGTPQGACLILACGVVTRLCLQITGLCSLLICVIEVFRIYVLWAISSECCCDVTLVSDFISMDVVAEMSVCNFGLACVLVFVLCCLPQVV